MRKSIYLSVDLDYWCLGDMLWSGAMHMLKKLYKLGKPMIMVADHGNMLDDINMHPCTTLVNIDAHSDIQSYRDFDINRTKRDCGNWVNFVRWQPDHAYWWYHTNLPDEWCDGYCHGDDPSPFVKKYRHKDDWAGVSMRRGMLPAAQLQYVAYIGIAISEDWLNSGSQVEDALRFAMDHDIRFLDIESKQIGFYQVVDPKLIKLAKEKLRR